MNLDHWISSDNYSKWLKKGVRSELGDWGDDKDALVAGEALGVDVIILKEETMTA